MADSKKDSMIHLTMSPKDFFALVGGYWADAEEFPRQYAYITALLDAVAKDEPVRVDAAEKKWDDIKDGTQDQNELHEWANRAGSVAPIPPPGPNSRKVKSEAEITRLIALEKELKQKFEVSE